MRLSWLAAPCAAVVSLSASIAMAGPYNETGIPSNSSSFVEWANAATITRGPQDIAIVNSPAVTFGTPAAATGVADNSVVSLGDGGNGVMSFAKPIVDRTGNDFAVFENAFASGGGVFAELGYVAVSSDGINYFTFPSVSLTQTAIQQGSGSITDPTNIHDLAGKDLAKVGTGFDLSELPISPLLDLTNVQFVRVTDVVGDIDPAFARLDSQGHTINDPFPTNFNSSGFDLDAVGVINQVPEPTSLAGLIGLVAMGGLRRVHK